MLSNTKKAAGNLPSAVVRPIQAVATAPATADEGDPAVASPRLPTISQRGKRGPFSASAAPNPQNHPLAPTFRQLGAQDDDDAADDDDVKPTSPVVIVPSSKISQTTAQSMADEMRYIESLAAQTAAANAAKRMTTPASEVSNFAASSGFHGDVIRFNSGDDSSSSSSSSTSPASESGPTKRGRTQDQAESTRTKKKPRGGGGGTEARRRKEIDAHFDAAGDDDDDGDEKEVESDDDDDDDEEEIELPDEDDAGEEESSTSSSSSSGQLGGMKSRAAGVAKYHASEGFGGGAMSAGDHFPSMAKKPTAAAAAAVPPVEATLNTNETSSASAGARYRYSNVVYQYYLDPTSGIQHTLLTVMDVMTIAGPCAVFGLLGETTLGGFYLARRCVQLHHSSSAATLVPVKKLSDRRTARTDEIDSEQNKVSSEVGEDDDDDEGGGPLATNNKSMKIPTRSEISWTWVHATIRDIVGRLSSCPSVVLVAHRPTEGQPATRTFFLNNSNNESNAKKKGGKRDAASVSGSNKRVEGVQVLQLPTFIRKLNPTIDATLQAHVIPGIVKHKTSVVCAVGSTGVGKSTLCRYLCNALLSQHGVAYLLDLDVGQGEFAPSGCITISRIDKLLEKPNDVESVTVLNKFFVGGSRLRCPVIFCRAIAAACHAAESLRPLVVNTHGWTDGSGRRATIEALRRIATSGSSSPSPVDVIHLIHHFEERWVRSDVVFDPANGLGRGSYIAHLSPPALTLAMPSDVEGHTGASGSSNSPISPLAARRGLNVHFGHVPHLTPACARHHQQQGSSGDGPAAGQQQRSRRSTWTTYFRRIFSSSISSPASDVTRKSAISTRLTVPLQAVPFIMMDAEEAVVEGLTGMSTIRSTTVPQSRAADDDDDEGVDGRRDDAKMAAKLLPTRASVIGAVIGHCIVGITFSEAFACVSGGDAPRLLSLGGSGIEAVDVFVFAVVHSSPSEIARTGHVVLDVPMPPSVVSAALKAHHGKASLVVSSDGQHDAGDALRKVAAVSHPVK